MSLLSNVLGSTVKGAISGTGTAPGIGTVIGAAGGLLGGLFGGGGSSAPTVALSPQDQYTQLANRRAELQAAFRAHPDNKGSDNIMVTVQGKQMKYYDVRKELQSEDRDILAAESALKANPAYPQTTGASIYGAMELAGKAQILTPLPVSAPAVPVAPAATAAAAAASALSSIGAVLGIPATVPQKPGDLVNKSLPQDWPKVALIVAAIGFVIYLITRKK